jgi:hypothetical protein
MLQELIAPRQLSLFDNSWTSVGTKKSLCEEIPRTTAIPSSVLQGKRRVDGYSVAERMFWASNRDTTREEDNAYCLIGIFGINMPLLYGEGRNAFIRLQEEIIKKSCDDSILAWNLIPKLQKLPSESPSLNAFPVPVSLASSPQAFQQYGGIQTGTKSRLTVTNRGINLCLPLFEVKLSDGSTIDHVIGLSSCRTSDGMGFVGILLLPDRQNEKQFHRFQMMSPEKGYQRIYTIVVDPRAASAAVSHTITLVDMPRFAPAYLPEFSAMIVIIRSPQINSKAFEIRTALQLNSSVAEEVRQVDRTFWNEEFETFSFPPNLIPGRDDTNLICNFRSELYDVEFSVILWRYQLRGNYSLHLCQNLRSGLTNKDFRSLIRELSANDKSMLSI